MKKAVKELNIDELTSKITEKMRNDLEKIQEVLNFDLDNLIKMISNLSDEDKDKVVGKIINNQLEKLKFITIEQFNNISRDIENITDYYTSKKRDFSSVIEEGDYVADEILYKVIGYNNRKIELPIDISIIKKYCFSTDLREEQFYDAFLWIALRYIAIVKSLNL